MGVLDTMSMFKISYICEQRKCLFAKRKRNRESVKRSVEFLLHSFYKYLTCIPIDPFIMHDPDMLYVYGLYKLLLNMITTRGKEKSA